MPNIGDTQTLGSRTMTWDGKKWNLTNTITQANQPPQNQIATPGTTSQAPNANASPTLRDYTKEQEKIKALNLSPLQMSMLEPKTIYEATYSPSELTNLPEYQQILARNQAQADLGATQRPTNSVMGILENALRAKSDVAKQSLGTSDLYAQAGLPTQGVSGYTTLLDSLNQRKSEMQDKYISFKDQVTQMAGSMANIYNQALDKYKVLNEDYQSQVDRMNQITQSIIDHEEQLALINEQAKLNERYLKLQSQLADTEEPSNVSSALTSDTTGMKNLGTSDFSDNCVLYNRSLNPSLPFGLFTKADKQKAVELAGNTDMSQIKIGDSILTGEGKWGHVARVIGIEGDNLILDEANYISGKITQGRKLNKNDNIIYGFIANKGKPSSTTIVSPQDQMKRSQEQGEILQEGVTEGIDKQVQLADGNRTLDTTDIMAIGKLVYGVRISDKETQIVQKAASENPGLDRFGLIQKVLGFNVEKNKDLGMKIMEVLQQTGGENGLMQYDWLSIANLLNNDKKTEAIALMERYVYDKAMKENQTNYISESTAIEATSKANAILEMVKQLEATGDNPIGNFEGTIEQWLGRFKSGDAQKIATKTMQMVKEFSNKFLGSAMTKTELDFYRDIMPSLIDSTGNFNIKLTSLKQDPLAKINSIRQSYNLPLLDENALMDKSLRPTLYGASAGNTIQVIGADGNTYEYDLDNPDDKKEYEEGVKAKFFPNK